MADLAVDGRDVVALDLARAVQMRIGLVALAGRDLLGETSLARDGAGRIAAPQYGASVPVSGGIVQYGSQP